MSPLTGRVQEIEKRVDELPGHITTEGLHQHSISRLRTLPRLAPSILNVRVRVRTMMNDEPNKNSEILFAGSRTLLGFLIKFEDIPKAVC